MAKATRKETPDGKSHTMKDGPEKIPSLESLHKGGKTVPTFQAARIDKLTAKPKAPAKGTKGR